MSFVYAPEDADLQYVEEETYGETPSGAGQPDMLWIGIIQDILPALDPSNLKLRGLNRDLSYIRRGLRKPDITVTYVLQLSSLTGFLRYGLDWITKSMSIEYFVEQAETIVSLNHKGCKVNRLNVNIPEEDWVNVTQECFGQNVAVATSKIGDNYESDPATDPYSWFDVKVYQDAVEFLNFGDVKFNINNNLTRKPVIRASNSHLLKYLTAGPRDLNGEIKAYFENKNEIDDIIADTAFDLKIYLGAKYFTFGGAKWDLAEIATRMSEVPCTMRLPWTAKTVTLT